MGGRMKDVCEESLDGPATKTFADERVELAGIEPEPIAAAAEVDLDPLTLTNIHRRRIVRRMRTDTDRAVA